MGEIPNKEARPEDIPQDVWDSAEIAWKRGSVRPIEQIARAILAERERCASIAESDFHRARAGLSVADAIRTGAAHG